MFRVIKNTSIFGQAWPKASALKQLSANSENLNSHIIKCVVYKYILPEAMHHWTQEIANYLYDADAIVCKSKLKSQDYIDTVFGMFGDSQGDAYLNLKQFKARYVSSSHEYPEFDINSDAIDDLFDAYRSVISKALPMLMSKQQHSKSELHAIITEIFYLYF